MTTTTILRRLDAVLEPTKQAVLDEATKRGDSPAAAVFLTKALGQRVVRVFLRNSSFRRAS